MAEETTTSLAILVVAADPLEAGNMAAKLGSLDLPVKTASSAEQAMIAANKGEVMLLVIWATNPTGPVEHAIRGLRSAEATRLLPILVCCPSGTLDRRPALMDAGATDCMIAPAESFELLLRVKNALRMGSLEAGLTPEAPRHEESKKEIPGFGAPALTGSAAQLSGESLDVLLTLANAAEHKQGIDVSHHKRIVEYCRIFCRALHWFDHETDAVIAVASALHDVGKAGLTDMVLMKPGLLTNEEFEEMKRHTVIGAEILSKCPGRMAAFAAEIARSHHERWDGAGYPDKLAGEDIPKAARIVALADAFDALQSHRMYRPEYPVEQCYEMIKSQAGKQFDPEVVEIFHICRPDIEEILAAAAR